LNELKLNEPASLYGNFLKTCLKSSLRNLVCGVSASEMIAELPKLSRKERRQLAVAIFELEEEADPASRLRSSR